MPHNDAKLMAMAMMTHEDARKAGDWYIGTRVPKLRQHPSIWEIDRDTPDFTRATPSFVILQNLAITSPVLARSPL